MPPAQFGIVLSSFAVGYMLAQVPGGLLADRYGAKVVLVTGSLFWAFFTGATGLVSTVLGFVAVRALFGAAEGASNSSLYKIIGENFEVKERSRVLSWCSTAYPLGPAFAGALVGKLVSVFGWKGMFMTLAGPALVAALLSYLLLPTRAAAPADRQPIHPLGFSQLRSMLRQPSLWWLCGSAFAWNINYWGYLGWMPSYLAMSRHIDLKAVGPIGGVPYVFALIGLLVVGWLGSGPLHRHCSSLIVTCFVGAGLFLYLAYQATTFPISLVGLSGAALFMFGALGPIGKVVLDLAPAASRATYIAVFNMAGQLGGVVAPMLIGLLVSRTGTFAAGFGFMIGALSVATVGIVVLAWLSRDALPAAPTAPATRSI